MTVPSAEITALLRAWQNGNRESLNRLMPVVYGELQRAARNYMRRERTDHDLQATALVNEVNLRLVDITTHFCAIAASMTPQSVKRDWKLARAWLLNEPAGAAAV